MKTTIRKKLTLNVLFDDGTAVPCRFEAEKGTFDLPEDKLVLGHEVKKLLRVEKAGEEGLIVVSYVFDGDYSPRRFNFPVGESLTITDHMTVLKPALGDGYQRVRLVLESEAEESVAPPDRD